MAFAVCWLALVAPASASPESRTFVVRIDPGAYGIDRCLAAASDCGTAAASAYCRSQGFAQVRSFRNVVGDDLAAIANAPHIAIECVRFGS
jgi:hypothetical protein